MLKSNKDIINIVLTVSTLLGLSLLLCLPEVCYMYYNGVNISRFLCTITLAFFISSFLLAIPSKIAKWILIIFIWLLSFAELVMLVSFYSYLTCGEIIACFCGTKQEWLMLLGFFWVQNKVWWIGSIVLLGSILFSVIKIHSVSLRLIINAAIAGILCIFAILFSPTKIKEIFPLCTCYNISCSIKELTTLYKEQHKQCSISYNANHQDSSMNQKLFVLAIGESLRYKNLGINGLYARQTTPMLSECANLELYSDCFASGVLTQYSLPLLLSSATATTFDEHYKEGRIGKVFKEAEFKTYIVSHSNQCTNDGVHTYLRYGFDSVIYVKEDSLIAPCINEISKNEEKAFILVHYQGNHFFYANRTPAYGKWLPDINDNLSAKSDSLFINAYDNSVLYTDYILSQGIKALDTLNRISTFVFISDHGDYFDERIAVHGHTYHPTKEEYHVPLMVWYSDEYKEAYPEKVANVIKHKDEPVCADHVFWSVLDMADIRIDSTLQQDGMSVFGDTLLPHRRTLLLPDGRSVLTLD